MGAVPAKSCIRIITPNLLTRHVAKFHEATLFGSKVLAANTLHFNQIFDPLFKKNKKSPIPGGGYANKTW